MTKSVLDQAKFKLRPELELVRWSARVKCPENDKRIKTLLGEELDWSEILACAVQHKLVPDLYERVSALDPGKLTQGHGETLAEVARLAGRSNLAFLNEMLRLNREFEAAGIPVIPFKGPALAWLAYPNFARRTYTDLDFVLPQRCIPQATSVLQACGYIPVFTPVEGQAGQNGPSLGQYAFSPRGGRSFVELHTERTLRYFSRPLDLEELSARLIRLEIGGQTVRTFSVEDLLVMLCVHGAKHFWERLAWIVDIAQLITVCEVNWRLLAEIVEKTQSKRLLLLGLYLAHEMFDAPLPKSILASAQSDAQVQWLAIKVFELYSRSSDSRLGVFPRAVFRLRSCDGLWQGLRKLVRLSMIPTESDRETIRLPAFLSPVYSLVRLFRLVGQYGLNRGVKPDLAIYVPTPQEIIDQMLSLAQVAPGDVLYDLGSGDGRIVVTAAERYGIRAVGVENNPTRIAEARANARRHGVEDRAQFILGDAKKVDLKGATVITMYLGADGNLRLADRLREQLRSGARIVSRDFLIYGWNPERTENRFLSNGLRTSLYLWTIKEAGKEKPADGDAAPELRHTYKAGG